MIISDPGDEQPNSHIHTVDYTIIDRQEAYMMYVKGEITRRELYDYLHDRTMWLIEESKNIEN